MTTATHHRSTLALLRDVVPTRPLRYDEALRLAEFQATHLLHLADVTTPAVPSELITDLPRVWVAVVSGLPVSGAAHWVNGRWIVTLAAGDHPRRRRFTLAHELKHVLDHPCRQVLFSGFDDTHRPWQTEHVADAFAAALLMSKLMVRRAFTDGVQDPYDLARIFDVSPTAMRVRLTRLGLYHPPRVRGTTWRTAGTSSHPSSWHLHDGAYI